jgi:hypothetical protein
LFSIQNMFLCFVGEVCFVYICVINPLNAELNPICHLLALLGARRILHVSRIRVQFEVLQIPSTAAIASVFV